MSENTKPTRKSLLRRLLGPAGPELSCEECFEQLDRYVELELEAADADAAIPGMRAHFEGCSACGEDHGSLRALLERAMGRRRHPPAPPDGRLESGLLRAQADDDR